MYSYLLHGAGAPCRCPACRVPSSRSAQPDPLRRRHFRVLCPLSDATAAGAQRGRGTNGADEAGIIYRLRCDNSHFFAPALSSVPRSRCGGCIGICSRSIGPPESTTTRPCWCCSYSGTKLWAWSTRLLTYSWASTATTISPTWSGRCVKEGTSLQRTRWVQRGPCGVGATAGRGAWTRAHRRLFLGTPSAGVSKSFRLRRFVVRPG